MGHPPVLILGYSEAAMLLGGPSGPAVGAVVAIRGMHEPLLNTSTVARRLVLSFDDIDVPVPGDVIAELKTWSRRKWEAEVGGPQVAPSIDDAAQLIAFARSIRTIDGALLCQCQGGISRSAAAALLCLAAWTNPGQETACAEAIARSRPAAAPHAGLVRFGDELLGRHGMLVRAAAEIPGSGGRAAPTIGRGRHAAPPGGDE